jgi:hypothetical protein
MSRATRAALSMLLVLASVSATASPCLAAHGGGDTQPSHVADTSDAHGPGHGSSLPSSHDEAEGTGHSCEMGCLPSQCSFSSGCSTTAVSATVVESFQIAPAVAQELFHQGGISSLNVPPELPPPRA